MINFKYHLYIGQGIKNFLDKKGNIIKNTKKINSNFLEYFKSRNKFFKLNNLKKNNFEMYDNYYDLKQNIFAYFLQSKTGNTFISFKNEEFFGKKISFLDEKLFFIMNYVLKNIDDNIKNNIENSIIKTKIIKYKGKKIKTFFIVNKIDKNK